MTNKNIYIYLNLLKNASLNNCSTVQVKNTKHIFNITLLLYNEGFINGFYMKNNKYLVIFLKYYKGICLLKNLNLYGSFVNPYYISYIKLLRLKTGPIQNNYFILLNTSYG